MERTGRFDVVAMTMSDRKIGYCGATTRSGGECRREAGWGTNHLGIGRCKLHGGSTPTHVKAAEYEMAERAAKSINLTVLPDVHPGDAILNEVRRCQQMVSHISEQIENLEYDEVAGLMVTRVTDSQGVERTVSANIWVKLLGEWSDRLTRTSKVVLDAGIAERQTQVQEAQAQAFARVLYDVLADLGVETGPETVSVVRRHMLTIDAAEVDTSAKAS